ncbi:hypothetical protein HW450_07025 [Corynebacterium hindlerae]|uniref:Uncharacterized protein n=1 Tax=Corynebacterium hindlerae TaxID=699041 RepID=A0A7G5FBZ5_9CORY|nr:hypothetical protein [Corynebacterium hindlerae]QMV84136.1 hypothetical protein HW450_07025 [Corynebacterium hindlerae]
MMIVQKTVPGTSDEEDTKNHKKLSIKALTQTTPGLPAPTHNQKTKNKSTWHTIEFSNNTRTTNPHQQNQRKKEGLSISDSFSYRHTHSSGALSVALTHIKLHTPNQQYKPAGKTGFLEVYLLSLPHHLS